MTILSFLTLISAILLVVFSRLAVRTVREDQRNVRDALDESVRQLEEVASIVDRISLGHEMAERYHANPRGQGEVYEIRKMRSSVAEQANHIDEVALLTAVLFQNSEISARSDTSLRGYRKAYEMMVDSFMREPQGIVHRGIVDWPRIGASMTQWPVNKELEKPFLKKVPGYPLTLPEWYSAPSNATRH